MTERRTETAEKALPGNNGQNWLSERFPGQTATAILNALYDECGAWRIVARTIGGVSPALCWKVANGQCRSAKMDYALGIKETRTRIAADVTPAQRDALHALAAERGLTWSEYCRKLADGELRVG